MKSLFGELIGTFMLVFIGCGSVGFSILIHPLDLWQIALTWGLGVTLAILVSSRWSQGHLNPAVTIGFRINGSVSNKDLLHYFLGQFFGAFLAGIFLLLIFQSYIDVKSIDTAMMFGEYYPNPGNQNLAELSDFSAFSLEAVGTFFLMLGILLIVGLKLKHSKILNPVLIGLLLGVLIYFIAPLTQAGFNPARDLSPRLLSYFAGWKMAFSYNDLGWFVCYVAGPIIGAILASLLYKIKKSNPITP
jgi:glycerol uptake facilitator